MSTPSISSKFPFQSRFVEVLGSPMRYVDEGHGDPILFLHGNPTSSYLWRNVIPHLTPAARCIAVDLIGMGRSAAPDIGYRFVDHVGYLEGFIESLRLDDLTLVVHDWGSALGFHYARRHEARVRGIAFMEAFLMPVGSWDGLPDEVRSFLQALRREPEGRQLAIEQNVFIEQVLPAGVLRDLTAEEMDHYRAPFRDPSRRRPLLQWPREAPIGGEPADVTAIVSAYADWLARTTLPKLLVMADPGTEVANLLAAWCQDRYHNLTVAKVGPGLHFLQEDSPAGVGRAIAEWYAQISPRIKGPSE